MHVHKPKIPHSLREFGAEIGVIVVGILIALAGEQLVVWVHGQQEVADAREALRSELSYDAAALKAMAAQDDCADARLSLLEAWGEGKARLNSTHLASMQNRPLLYTLKTTAWEVTTSSAIAGRMPLKDRLAFADVYDQLANEKSHVLDERRAWDLVARYAGKAALTADEARNLNADLGSVRVRDDDRRFNAPYILRAIARLGIKPIGPPSDRDPHQLCEQPV
ncbi:MAG TPA: hypothetical protein VG407_11090 [Caulobacteraceae bacterium]|jgi:hypothetical protein|nr:hypothetical protein [Caulobacteraceae bacterium]